MTSINSKKWEKQSCEGCRHGALAGLSAPLTRLGSIDGGNSLYRCEKCGAYWEEINRYAHPISKEEAEAFLKAIEDDENA